MTEAQLTTIIFAVLFAIEAISNIWLRKMIREILEELTND